MVEPAGVTIQTEPTFFEKPMDMASNSQSIDVLRANPMIQKLVEERVAVLESRMRSKSCFTGTQRKRTPYDDLSLGQFVVGYINNVLETQHVDTMKHMLTELGETVKLAENLSWPIARGGVRSLYAQN